MINWSPQVFVGLGFVLLVIGVMLPLLMILQVIPSTFFLNFFAYGSSFLGLIFGIIGTVQLTIRRRK